MKTKGRINLRNRIERFLNEHATFGCKVHSGVTPSPKKQVKAKERFFWRFVTGTAKDGRTILIYPMILRNERIPVPICEYMKEIESRNALVGTAENLGDAYTIVVDDPIEYKRAKKTRMHEYWLQQSLKKETDGSRNSEG